LQTNADLGQAFAALEAFAVFETRVMNRNRSVNAVIVEESIDDREMAALSSLSDGVVVVGRRIDARIKQQPFDDRDAAILSSPSDSAVVAGRRIDALVL
jgi:hypothetical protein